MQFFIINWGFGIVTNHHLNILQIIYLINYL